LNTMLPLMGYNLLQSIELLAASVNLFAGKCVEGITANREKCALNIERSLALSTHLVPAIGYDRAAAVAKEAFKTGKTIREVVLAERIMTEDELNRLLCGKDPLCQSNSTASLGEDRQPSVKSREYTPDS